MRSWTKILASSVPFTSATTAFTSPLAPTTSQFTGPAVGAFGGPQQMQQSCGIAMQGMIGQVGASTGFGGTFQLLGSNVNEAPMFYVIASCAMATTGPCILRDSAPWYRYADFKFIPSLTGTSGVFSVVYHQKGNF